MQVWGRAGREGRMARALLCAKERDAQSPGMAWVLRTQSLESSSSELDACSGGGYGLSSGGATGRGVEGCRPTPCRWPTVEIASSHARREGRGGVATERPKYLTAFLGLISHNIMISIHRWAMEAPAPAPPQHPAARGGQVRVWARVLWFIGLVSGSRLGLGLRSGSKVRVGVTVRVRR